MSDIVHVAVAVIINDRHEVCISFRSEDSHQGGLWEFPGGKIEKFESVEQALVREIKEELDLLIESSRPLITIPYDYQDKKVCLHVHKVLEYSGVAVGVERQQVKWLPLNQLATHDFPAANETIIRAVQLPEKYLITGKFIDETDFLARLTTALERDIRLVQIRLKQGDLSREKMTDLLQKASSLCTEIGATMLLNVPADYLGSIDISNLASDGFHTDSRTLMRLTERPAGKLFSASCHNREEILQAERLNADFIVLSPVQKTASHPDMQAIGWPEFSRLLEGCAIPVYALGGVSQDDIQKAWLHGAQGVAAISAFWH